MIVGAGFPWPRPGLLARALESPVVEACSLSRADGVSRALSGPWVLAALCAVPSELARAAFEESGRQKSPEQSNTTMTPKPGALTWAAHNHLSHLIFIKLIMLFLAAEAAAPDPATVIISKVS